MSFDMKQPQTYRGQMFMLDGLEVLLYAINLSLSRTIGDMLLLSSPCHVSLNQTIKYTGITSWSCLYDLSPPRHI